LDEYKEYRWDDLKKKLMNLYNADRDESRYNLGDLDQLIDKYAAKTLHKLSDWKAYVCNFTVIAQWLKADKVIQTEQYQTYFWLGVSEDMKKTAETHIMAGNTAKDISQPFTMDKISTVVERLLHHHRFDRRRQRRRYKYQDDDSESDSSDESDCESSDSDDSDYDPKPTKEKASKCTKPAIKPNKLQTKSQLLSEQTNKTKDEVKPSKKSSNDINVLVKQMSKLNISDPSYAQAYFKALTLNPLIAEVFEQPRKVTTFTGNKDHRTTNILNSESPRATPQRGTTSTNTKQSSPPTMTPPFTCLDVVATSIS
jgi:hypothetical protein